MKILFLYLKLIDSRLVTQKNMFVDARMNIYINLKQLAYDKHFTIMCASDAIVDVCIKIFVKPPKV